MLKLVRVLTVLIGVFVASALPAAAADYPRQPVRVLVGLAAGGGTDIVARLLAEWLSENLGQQFIVENRTGMGGSLAAQALINAPVDGYTLLFMGPNNAIATSLYKKLPYDFLRDTTPVASIMQLTNMLVVSNAMPVKTVQEFIDYCKANPGKINMASSGSGTSVHLSGELFKFMTGCDMLHVPYKGAGPALADLIPGQVHVLFDNLPSSIGHIRGGKLRALAVTSAERSPELPGVPAVAETVPGFEFYSWYGLWGPAKLPNEMVQRLNAEVNKALAGDMRDKLVPQGLVLTPGSVADFVRFQKDDMERSAKIITEGKIRVE